MDLITQISNQYELLTNISKHHRSSFENIKDFHANLVNAIELSNSESRNVFSRYYTNQISIENNFNNHVLASYNKDESNASLTYELYSLTKTNEVLSILDKQYAKTLLLTDKFKINALGPNEDFYSSICGVYDYCLEVCRSLILSATEASKSLDKLKSEYFLLVNEAEDAKRKMDTHSHKLIDAQTYKDRYLKYTSLAQIAGEHIKYELVKTNGIYQEVEQRFNEIVQKVKSNEESRISYILSQESKFAKLMTNIGFVYSDIGKEMESKFEENSQLITTEFLNQNIPKASKNTQFQGMGCLKAIKFNKESFEDISNQARVLSTQSLIREMLEEDSDFFSRPNHKSSIYEEVSQLEHYFDLQNAASDFVHYAESEIERNMINFWNGVRGKHQISADFIRQIVNFVVMEPKASKILIDIIFDPQKKAQYYKLLNISNLNHLANIINTIATKHCMTPMMNSIIFMGERTYFQRANGEKIYLCSILSQNKLYNRRDVWMRLFNTRLAAKVQEGYYNCYNSLVSLNYGSNVHSNHSSFKVEEKTSDPNQTKSSSFRKNSKDLKDNKDDGNGIFGKLKNIFSIEKEKRDEPKRSLQSEKSIVFDSIHSPHKKSHSRTGLIFLDHKHSRTEPINLTYNLAFVPKSNNHITEHSKLNPSDKMRDDSLTYMTEHPNPLQFKLISKMKMEESYKILKVFINHLSNFNYDVSEAIEFVVDIFTNFNFPKENLSIFITLLNTSTFTIRSNRQSKNDQITKQKTLKKPADFKCFALSLSMRFLDLKDTVNLFAISKSISQKLQKDFSCSQLRIEKKVIENLNLTVSYQPHEILFIIKKRLAIWELILHVPSVRKKLNYKGLSTLLTRIQSSKYLDKAVKIKREGSAKLSTSDLETESKILTEGIQMEGYENLRLEAIIDNFSIINLDVQRTYFSFDVDKNRKVVETILKLFVLSLNSSVYCQGMNYIVSYLYYLTKNEETAFHLFYGLYTNSDFGSVFSEELSRLRQFFYIFDRLLLLYTPEISNYFLQNNIGSSYYCSPWFMTLFTNCYQTNDAKVSLVLIKIWDEFLLNGWRAVLKTAIVLFMINEEIILSLKYEDMLNFLFNDVLKSGFFNNENLTKFISVWENMSFPDELINNLENEYLQDCKLVEENEKLSQQLEIK